MTVMKQATMDSVPPFAELLAQRFGDAEFSARDFEFFTQTWSRLQGTSEQRLDDVCEAWEIHKLHEISETVNLVNESKRLRGAKVMLLLEDELAELRIQHSQGSNRKQSQV